MQNAAEAGVAPWHIRLHQRGVAAGRRLLPLLTRYSVVSIVALGADFAAFLALAHALHVLPALAGATGYGLGLVVHFVLSSRFVFRVASAKSTVRLFGEFALSGVVGLAMTTVVIHFATTLLGLPPLAAKLIAVAASFLAVFQMRRRLVFRAA